MQAPSRAEATMHAPDSNQPIQPTPSRATRRHSTTTTTTTPVSYSKVFPVILSFVCLLIMKSTLHRDRNDCNYVAEAFHLSFAHRLVKSIQGSAVGNNNNQEPAQQQQHYSAVNPLLNPPENLIRPIECRNANNQSEVGICMFSIDCMQNKGVPLSICKHNYFVGTCCKLPDYNNFVGIVYDLRETDSSASAASVQQQQVALEARRGSSDALHIFKSSSSSPGENALLQSNVVERRPADAHASQQGGVSSTSQPEINSSSPHSGEAASTAPSATRPSTQSSASLAPLGDTSKYLISSTKLFGSTRQPPETVLKSSTVGLETARNNADSNVAQLHQQQQSPPSSHISFGSINDNEQSAGAQSNSSLSAMNSAYELLAVAPPAVASRTPLPTGQQPTIVDQAAANNQQTIVISSAHSDTTSSNKSGPPEDELSAEVTSSAHHPRPAQTTTAGSGGFVYLVNNHQPVTTSASSTVGALSSSSAGTTLSDQEFTLSTSSAGDLRSASASEQPPSAATEESSPTRSSVQEQSNQQTNSSPFVDLVSSSLAVSTSSPIETTTPFTSSLSTAILPSISSHPYVPTTTTTQPSTTTPLPPASSVQSTQTSQAAAVDSSSSSPLFSTSQTLVSASTQASSSAPGNVRYGSTTQSQHEASSASSGLVSTQTSGSSSTPLFVAQYYSTAAAPLSTAHTSAEHVTPQVVHSQHSHHTTSSHHHRPLASNLTPTNPNLQVASKIVTGHSGANNLIPGLSGLQSAILAHIPFKIASGLSSGLSSYLQAAMKPQSSGRPLISSNTAPALQYQQHEHQSQQHNQSTASKQPATSGSHGATAMSPAVRFPASSSSTTSSEFSSQATPTMVSQQRDVAKEAQLVCGRPRVATADSTTKTNKRSARIVGGNQSAFGQWPWMVSLRQWRKGAFLHKCGAALLNENWAITAAHCVENVKAPDLLLRLGEFDVSNQNEPYPYIERRVKTVVSHPSFDPKTFEYDLALIRFTEPIQYERNIIPVCVPQGNDSYVDRMATVIGWGRLFEDGPLPDVIQHVDVPIITNQECEKMYKSAGFVEEIPEMFICAGISKGGRDSCEGDSGGPLTMVDHDGRSYLVGIISWGIGCALPSQPGVYTRITAFSSWINQIIAN